MMGVSTDEVSSTSAAATAAAVGTAAPAVPRRWPRCWASAAAGHRRRPWPRGTPRLAIGHLKVAGVEGRSAVDGLTLNVMPGEIVGVAGVSGNGQRELVAALTGALPIAGGQVWVDGQPYLPTRRMMRELGVRSLPEEPLHNACVGKLAVADNLALRGFDRAPLARGPWLSRSTMRAQALAKIAAFKVKTPGPDALIETLSGGNVQRAVLARELDGSPAAADRRQPLLRAGLPGQRRDPRAAARRARRRRRRAAGQRGPGRDPVAGLAHGGAVARPCRAGMPDGEPTSRPSASHGGASAERPRHACGCHWAPPARAKRGVLSSITRAAARPSETQGPHETSPRAPTPTPSTRRTPRWC